MSKIAVLGNCQVESMGRCLAAFLPSFEVITLNSWWDMREPEQAPRVIDKLHGCDVIFAQPLFSEYGREISRALAQQRENVQIWPVFAFTGFHPDITYVYVENTRIKSPMDDYHSLITLGAFLADLSIDETEQLFNGFVYAQLGYYDEYPRAKEAMISMALPYGLDLRHGFGQWEQRGCFVYSINHPKLYVIADIAKLVLERAGLSFAAGLPVAELFDDPLAVGCVWPVYPELGKRLNCCGSLEFNNPLRQVFSLTEMISGSFDAYAPLPREALNAISGVDRVLDILRG